MLLLYAEGDPLSESGSDLILPIEDYIAALNIGAYVREAQGFEDGLEFRHRQYVVTADVDAAEECDPGLHG